MSAPELPKLKLLDVETIEHSSLEDFIGHYATVKSLVENQDQLQRLVDAVNDRLKDVPEVFRPDELSLGKKLPTKQKNWRLDEDQKYAWAYAAVQAMTTPTFMFADLWEWFERVRHELNKFRDEDLAATKSSLSAGIKMLHHNGIIARHVPKNEDGKAMFAKTEYELKPAFKKSKHQQRKTIEEMLEAVETEMNEEVVSAE
jgi:predicted transcriptional regulator